MRTSGNGRASGTATFTQLKRRDQLVQCAIDAVVDVGYAQASVAEVARRAGVSKGVVTYHFPAKDDLIQAVVADVIAGMTEYLGPLWRQANPRDHPERFIAPYLSSWVGYIRTHGRDVLALVRIFNGLRERNGRPTVGLELRANEIVMVAGFLERGQEAGHLGHFDARTMAAVMKAALDDLLIQYADHPELDLDTYGAQLVAMFERATRPDE